MSVTDIKSCLRKAPCPEGVISLANPVLLFSTEGTSFSTVQSLYLALCRFPQPIALWPLCWWVWKNVELRSSESCHGAGTFLGSVVRVINLTIQLPPKYSRLCSACFQSVLYEITIHEALSWLQFLNLLFFWGWLLNLFAHSSLPCNGGSFKGFAARSSCGKATPLV